MKRGPARRKRLKTAERPIRPPKPRRSAVTALAARSAGSSRSGTKEDRKLGVMQFLCRPATPPPSWKGRPRRWFQIRPPKAGGPPDAAVQPELDSYRMSAVRKDAGTDWRYFSQNWDSWPQYPVLAPTLKCQIILLVDNHFDLSPRITRLGSAA